ncbi:PREDICTED: uncharacterized protein LOC104804899 [Tarenaya hassleriana]|uniref:uncharacterized protein LOC104804899 n=1 Tax=Tarenaya hassleriana TaxID=28532 RepID=UPI00053C25D1|nr:PREDICTED: uncharacterized protein LOC104804899 [Tarenaya hassleriana]
MKTEFDPKEMERGGESDGRNVEVIGGMSCSITTDGEAAGGRESDPGAAIAGNGAGWSTQSCSGGGADGKTRGDLLDFFLAVGDLFDFFFAMAKRDVIMSNEGGQSSQSASTNVAPKRTRKDPGWKYAEAVEENDTNTLVCKFCRKIMKGGITRVKEHLMGKKGNTTMCELCPKEVREEMWELHKRKRVTGSTVCSNEPMELDLDDLGFGLSDEEENPQVKRSKKGHMDLFVRRPEATSSRNKKEKMRQQNIKEVCDKDSVGGVHQSIARWWYQAGIPFNSIKMQSFQDMLHAIGRFGPNLPAPSYHQIRVPLLTKEVEYTKSLMKQHQIQWEKHGCSIMSDAWTDRKQRCLINFLVNSPAGTMFMKSIDGSSFVKTGQKLFEMLDSLVEEIGEDKVVQVITDNGSNYVLAGKMLEEKRSHLFWSPCAAHCVDLILEDIGKISSIKLTIKRAISVVGFIYNHSSTLSLLSQFTNKRELVRHAVTRFATSYLSLERLFQEKDHLRRMFTSNEWRTNKLAKEAKGKEAEKIVIMPSFWSNVKYTLKIMAPLVQVLRLVDSEKKAAMPYIYEAMDKAKEVIEKSFNNDESKYKDVIAIIDKRWDCQLHRPLHAAGHYLNPEYFYSNPGLERNMEVVDGLYQCIRSPKIGYYFVHLHLQRIEIVRMNIPSHI